MPKSGEKQAMPEGRYPEISKLLESEDFDKINKDFMAVFESLEKMSKMKGLKKAATARKGMRSIELTMDLLRELLKKKYHMMEQQGGETPPPKKK